MTVLLSETWTIWTSHLSLAERCVHPGIKKTEVRPRDRLAPRKTTGPAGPLIGLLQLP
jgi:hypothetical protein